MRTIHRGLFRLWLIGSILTLVITAVVYGPGIVSDLSIVANSREALARTVDRTDAEAKEARQAREILLAATNEAIKADFIKVLVIAFGGPALTMIGGLAMLWIIDGFRRSYPD